MALQQAQAQAQAAAQALLAGGTAQAGNARNPFWNMAGLGGGPPPMLGGGLQGGLPANFYPQMVAFAAAQENATAMVAVAKLGPSKASPATNSSLVVRGSVRKFNMNGVPFSVAEWTRKTVEENLEWLVKLSKRHSGGDKAILLAYGDGCETLVLLDQHVNKMPADFGKIKKVGVGVTMANIDSTLDESKLANQGVLQPGDSIWEHLRFETLGDKKAEKCLSFIRMLLCGERASTAVNEFSKLLLGPGLATNRMLSLSSKLFSNGRDKLLSFRPWLLSELANSQMRKWRM